MCGITGWVTAALGRPDESMLHRMCDAIRHRGPDSEGIHLAEGVALGARRLRIIDLATGDQPISNEDGSVIVVFNGEVYNFQEVRAELRARGHTFRTQGDTEVVVHAYEEYGEDFPRHLNGMFALALWDERRRRLVLARDRLGKKPLLVAPIPGGLAFGSEFSAILTHSEVHRDIDLEALDHALTLGYVPAPRSAFLGIRKLLPGHTLVWENGQSREQPYWSLAYEPADHVDEREAVEQFWALFADAVRLRLISDVPLGAFLSGGIDSSCVVAMMAEAAQGRVKTFSIGFADGAYNELPHARLVAERFGTDHHEFVVEPRAAELLPSLVRHYGEPYADSSALPTFELARLTRQYVTVALNGDGGDEVFGGYDRYRALMLADRTRAQLPVPPAFFGRVASLISPAAGQRTFLGRTRRFLNGLALAPGAQYARWLGMFSPEAKESLYAPAFAESVRHSRADRLLAEPFEQPHGLALAEVAMCLDLRTYLPDDLLVKVDIATMANALESRAPFLDYRLVEWAARLPLDLKIRRGVSKYLVKQAMRNVLPRSILNRRKAGFGVPLASWFRGDLLPMLRETVRSDRAIARGYFEPAAIRRLVDEHAEGRADYAPQLWTLLVLELWHQTFIDHPSPSPDVDTCAPAGRRESTMPSHRMSVRS